MAWGLLPNYPEKTDVSAEPADIIVSLVGTTSIGFNLFLGGAIAEGKKLRSAQRGIAFSTMSAFIVSVLILIVGAGYHADKYPDISSTGVDFFTDLQRPARLFTEPCNSGSNLTSSV